MPARTFSSPLYRYGFNGKEQDAEAKGAGAQYDYGMRVYDPRLGRFLSVDPLFKSYPWNSPYAFAENSPILNVDLDGGEKMPYYDLPKHTAGTEIKTINNTTVYKFTELGTQFRVAEYNTELMDGGPFKMQFHRNLYFVYDGTVTNESDYTVGDGSVVKTKGTNWHFWKTSNERSQAGKVTDDLLRKTGIAVFGAAAIGAAAPALAELAPMAWQGLANEASLLRYIPKSYGTYGKLFGANLGLEFAFNGKNADVYDAAMATWNPWAAFLTNPVVNYKPLAGDNHPTIGTDAPEVMAKKFVTSAPFFLLGASMQTANPAGFSATTDYLLNAANSKADNITDQNKPPLTKPKKE